MDTNFKASRLDLTWSFFISSLRTSETNYLNEAFSFYAAIRGRAYYSRANREDRYDFCRSVNPGSSKGQPHIFPPLSFFDLSLRRRSTFRRSTFLTFLTSPGGAIRDEKFRRRRFFSSLTFRISFSTFRQPGKRRDPLNFLFLSGTIMTFWLSLLLPMLDSEFVSNFFPSYRNTETRPTAWQNDHTSNKSSIWVPSSRGKQIKLLERTLGADSDQSGETQHKLPVLIYQLLNLTCQLELWWCLLSDKETWISSWDTTHNAS